MKKRIIFVENHKALMEIMPYLRMSGVRKVTKHIVPDTDVRIVEFKMNDYYYDSTAKFFSDRYPMEVVFATVGGR